MNDGTKTGLFVGVATILAGLASWTYFGDVPSNSEQFQLIGKPFYEQFTSSSQATSLEVIAIDDDGQLQRFNVRENNGVWTIPSHFDYPAEAVERLARTSASLIGLEREALAGRLKSEHDRLGVRDPEAEDLEFPETAGQRITLKDANDDVVVDLIIGNEVEDESPVDQGDQDVETLRDESQKVYYVRRFDEDQTYKVALNIDLSTKFSDWIDPDLLRIETSRLTNIVVDNYKLEERASVQGVALVKSQGDQISLSKGQPAGWQLEGIDEKTEKLNTTRVNEVVGVLDQMKIAGVRPKFTFKDQLLLTPELKLNERPEFKEDKQAFALAIRQMQGDLEEKGFNLAGGENGELQLVSRNGDLKIATDEGVVYTMNIGRAIEGSTEEIEVGGTTEGESKSADKENSENEEAKSEDADSNQEQKPETEAEANNRYLMIRVSFDEDMVANRPEIPVKPIEPPKPEGYQPAENQKKSEETPDDVDAPPVNPPENEKPDDKPDEKADGDQETDTEKPERKPEFVAYDQAMKEHEQKLADYALAMDRYTIDKGGFEKRVEEGKKRVDELNQRFGKWFYVISADNLKTLQLKREDLIEKVEAKPEPVRPNIQFPNIQGLNGNPNPPEPPMVESDSGNAEKENQPENNDENKNGESADPKDDVTPEDADKKEDGKKPDPSKKEDQGNSEAKNETGEKNKKPDLPNNEPEKKTSDKKQADPPTKKDDSSQSKGEDGQAKKEKS